MGRRSPFLVAVCVGLLAGSACEPAIDLASSLKLIPILTGYYDNGLNAAKENQYLPSITFQLKNEGDMPLSNVDMSIAFWEAGADGELDSKYIRGIGSTALAPGATTDPITVRSSVGYTSPIFGAGIFSHSLFKGMIVKVFAKRRGKTTKLGELPIEQRVLPAVPAGVPAGGSRP
jgi:hypothetical protein